MGLDPPNIVLRVLEQPFFVGVQLRVLDFYVIVLYMVAAELNTLAIGFANLDVPLSRLLLIFSLLSSLASLLSPGIGIQLTSMSSTF